MSAPTSPSQHQQQQQQTLSSSSIEGNDIHIRTDIIQPLLDGVTASALTPSPLPLPLPLPANAMANVLQLERELMMNEDDYSKQSTEEQKSDLAPLHHHGNSGLDVTVAVTVATAVSMNNNGMLSNDQSRHIILHDCH